MAQVGKVQAINGIVTARSENGQIRELQVGDFIYENEIITTSANASISIIGEDGSIISLAGNDQLLVDESVFGDIDPRDAVIQEVAELQEAIVEALAQNQNIDDITDDPAAGGLIDSYDFQTTYHAGDDSKGQVGAYLLDSNNETTTHEYNQYIADSPDEEIPAVATPVSTSPVSAPQAPAIPGTPATPTPTPTQPPVIIITDEDEDITSADNSVAEGSGATTSGSIVISAEAGVAAVTIAGQDISNATASPVVIIGDEGTLTITGYNPATGEITYEYTEDGEAEDHSAGDDSVIDQFTIMVTDSTGASSSDVLDIQIIDTAPVANPDFVTISEDLATPFNGNVITGTGADTLGADVTTVTGITGGNIGEEFSTDYGTLIINEDGSYIYELTPGNPIVQSLNDGETLTEEFTYTITDADGDTSEATLTITIDGLTDGAPTISIDDADADVTPADNSVVEGSGDTVNGAITVGAEAGISTVTIGGTDITDA
ncbi:retention module-containing protein, partial [Desulforhopalus sp. IMCC35007]|uniref:retention module-containing protein n=1 Tax=Desulforhopalus sp. IMCC35007 TaxID=2569543 RepID=UPI00145FB1C3